MTVSDPTSRPDAVDSSFISWLTHFGDEHYVAWDRDVAHLSEDLFPVHWAVVVHAWEHEDQTDPLRIATVWLADGSAREFRAGSWISPTDLEDPDSIPEFTVLDPLGLLQRYHRSRWG